MQRGPRVGVHGARVLALSHQLAEPLDVARRGGGVQLRRGDGRLLAAAALAGGAGGGGGVARQLGRVAPDRPREQVHAGALGGGECEVGQAELAAEAVVERGGEEEGEAGEAEVAVAEVVPLERVHLRVRVHVVHALDVDHHQLAARGVEGEAREGVGRGAVQAVEVERAGVVVVLHVGAALDGARRRASARRRAPTRSQTRAGSRPPLEARGRCSGARGAWRASASRCRRSRSRGPSRASCTAWRRSCCTRPSPCGRRRTATPATSSSCGSTPAWRPRRRAPSPP
mmetsp:Transcript_19297/g.61551  ORF Transcript_19297/g.61551 Transcript_19297/m.61551 type:complete len:286 (+) Transcript_19297:1310-2167(+)